MFDSPPNESRFRIDPWASDYGSGVDLDAPEEPEEGGARVRTDLETPDWSRPVPPVSRPRPRRIAFVDGVQRVDVWGQVEQGDRSAEAALASVAVGAAICEQDRASFQTEMPSRVLAVSRGVAATEICVRAGCQELVYEPRASAAEGRLGVDNAISGCRGELERAFAERLLDGECLVVRDGRLTYQESAARLVGLAKTLHKLYIDEDEQRLLPLLGAGERTPVFLIDYGQSARYSWFVRLPHTRPIHHALAGIVRIETPAAIGEAGAIDLAEITASALPAFASRPEHDARAPQNLLPVGALERYLRHQLGDPLFVRRAIESQIFREMAA